MLINGLLVALGVAVKFLYDKYANKTPPLPVDPNAPPTPPAPTNLADLIRAIIKAELDRFLPHVQTTVQSVVSNRAPVVTDPNAPQVLKNADGSYTVKPGKSA